MGKRFLIFSIFLNVLFISIGIFFLYMSSFAQGKWTHEIRENFSYKYINPLLECNIDFEYYNPGNIKTQLDSYLEKSISQGDILDAAYYVRLLKNGSNFWYHEDSRFIPASLVKLPWAISLLGKVPHSQLATTILTAETEDVILNRNIGHDTIEKGKQYSLSKLLSEMLINSDNLATSLIMDYIWLGSVHETYKRLWLWEVNLMDEESVKISVKNYASFFRILYNASYLSSDNSEYILELLTHSSFTYGIRAKLPITVTVANKFWERSLINGETDLHDCGIVYLTNSPYLICIMTRGTSFDTQVSIIQNISKMVYDDMSKVK